MDQRQSLPYKGSNTSCATQNYSAMTGVIELASCHDRARSHQLELAIVIGTPTSTSSNTSVVMSGASKSSVVTRGAVAVVVTNGVVAARRGAIKISVPRVVARGA